MENLPKDPVILLSIINMKLRDFYPNLDSLCADLALNKDSLLQTLATINYYYSSETNQFI